MCIPLEAPPGTSPSAPTSCFPFHPSDSLDRQVNHLPLEKVPFAHGFSHLLCPHCSGHGVPKAPSPPAAAWPLAAQLWWGAAWGPQGLL